MVISRCHAVTALAFLRSSQFPCSSGRCDWCANTEAQGHTPACPLAAAIEDAEELERRRGLRTRAEIVDRNCKACAYCEGLSWVLGESE